MKIIKFEAGWCNPCKQLARNIERDVPEDIKSLIQVIDVDQDEEMVAKYNVKNIPTILFVNDEGVDLTRMTGAITGKMIVDEYHRLNEIL